MISKIKRIWFKIVNGLWHRYYERLTPDINTQLFTLFLKCGINLYEVRFQRCVISIEDVDKVLAQYPDPVKRITFKNMLVQAKVMELREYAYVPDETYASGGQRQVSKRLDNAKLWHQHPIMPEDGSWKYPNPPHSFKELTEEELDKYYEQLPGAGRVTEEDVEVAWNKTLETSQKIMDAGNVTKETNN